MQTDFRVRLAKKQSPRKQWVDPRCDGQLVHM